MRSGENRRAAGVTRRAALRGAGGGGAALAALLGVSGLASLAAAQTDQAVAGVWRVVPTPTGGQPTPANFNVFMSDGTLINVAADQTRSIGVGRWIAAGDRQYDNTFWFHRFSESGTFAGSTKIVARIQLDETGNAFRGAFRSTVFDVGGSAIATREGSQEATRVEIEPFV